MNQKKSRWQGLRAIVVARQSKDADGTESNAAQVDYMQKELDRVGLLFVDKIALDGVAASAPAKIEVLLQALFARKRTRNDFDVIAWQVEDRASRSGGEHGMWLQHEANRHGLRVFFAGDDQPTVPFGAIVKVAKYEAAKETAVSTGRRSAQGQAWAIKKGFFRTAGHTPIGCDRIYCGADGQPKFILHNLPNGLQEQRDFATGQVLGTYGTVGKKSHNRFRKQKNEYSLLCPGDRQQRQVVRVIFYLRYKKGWRGARIADYLNRNAIPSPRGKEWSQRQVQIIYENEAYTGCTYNKTYSGRFFRRDRTLGFVPLDRDECELVQKKTFAPKLRLLEDWDRIDQPHMVDYLPRDVRDLAIAEQAKLAQERTDPNRKPKTPNAHPASLFFLSDRLRAVQGETLVGTMSGPPSHKTPYYRHRKGKRGRRKGSIFNNLIPAKPLHDAVLALLADVLQDTPNLRDRLRQHILDQRAAVTADHPDVVNLETERDDLQQKIITLTTTLNGAALKTAQPELQRLNDRLNALSTQIDTAGDQDAVDHRPVDVVVEEAMRIIQKDRARLHMLAPEALRQLTDRLITDAVVDMRTKAVELTVAIPTRAPKAPAKKKSRRGIPASEIGDEPLCPATSSRSSAYDWTQTITLRAKCQYAWTRGSRTIPPCYQCRRSAA